MAREIRFVKKNWEHPKNPDTGKYIPLRDGNTFKEDLKEYEQAKSVFDKAKAGCSFGEWYGEKPVKKEYTPVLKENELTHMQMYEDTTLGTPMSPVFKVEDKEGLASWLVENKIPYYANKRLSKEQWIDVIEDGYSMYAVCAV